MTCCMTTAAGEEYRLPATLEWELEYGSGIPCDSFRALCVWNCADDRVLADVIRFAAWHEGERVFTGVVDECSVSWSAQGCRLEIAGRGMAALLLDNEALGTDYDAATIQDILRNHVLPYGIQVAQQASFPAVEHFSVDYGSSEWAVLYQFARYHGGIMPRFDRNGKLQLTHRQDEAPIVIGDQSPVTGLRACDKRYGVLSEIWVREAGKQPAIHKAANESFKASGGQCRRMFTLPTKSNYQAMRYRGAYQLEQSASELLQIQVDVALPFCAWPGDLIRLERSGWGRNGLWRVLKSTVSMDMQGYRTRLVLVPPSTLV